MDWFLYDNGLRHERVNVIDSQPHSHHNSCGVCFGPFYYLFHKYITLHFSYKMLLALKQYSCYQQCKARGLFIQTWKLFSGFLVSIYNIKYKRKKRGLFNLTDFLTFAQLMMLHACIKVPRPRLLVVLEEQNHLEISESKERPFLIYPANQTQCVITAWGRPTQSTIKELEKTHAKSQRWKLEAVVIASNCTIASSYVRITQGRYIEVYIPISLEVCVLWSETGMHSLDPKWLPSKLIIESTELKLQSHWLGYFNCADPLSQ